MDVMAILLVVVVIRTLTDAMIVELADGKKDMCQTCEHIEMEGRLETEYEPRCLAGMMMKFMAALG